MIQIFIAFADTFSHVIRDYAARESDLLRRQRAAVGPRRAACSDPGGHSCASLRGPVGSAG
jgi:hypothetical protein